MKYLSSNSNVPQMLKVLHGNVNANKKNFIFECKARLTYRLINVGMHNIGLLQISDMPIFFNSFLQILTPIYFLLFGINTMFLLCRDSKHFILVIYFTKTYFLELNKQ